MSDAAAFIVLGIVAIAVGWPTWTWAVSFGLVVLAVLAELGSDS